MIASLKSAGFPDSYCNSLLALHQKYPDWQFVPVQTGLDWNTVIANESVVGRNLVQSSSNDARKSTETGLMTGRPTNGMVMTEQVGKCLLQLHSILHGSEKLPE